MRNILKLRILLFFDPRELKTGSPRRWVLLEEEGSPSAKHADARQDADAIPHRRADSSMRLSSWSREQNKPAPLPPDRGSRDV
jgi:hypothetical protein